MDQNPEKRWKNWKLGWSSQVCQDLWPSLQSRGSRQHPQGQKQAGPPFADRKSSKRE